MTVTHPLFGEMFFPDRALQRQRGVAMTLVFSLLTVQTLLGALDTLWNHEIAERLPATPRRAPRAGAACRAGVHLWIPVRGVGLARVARRLGGGSSPLALLLEVGVTIADFVVEDRTRRLPAFERVLHTVLTLLFGVLLMAIAPVLLDWWSLPTGVVAIDYGGFSVLLTLFAVGMTAWGLRDAVAALAHFRPAEWLRDPIESAPQASGRGILVTGATGFIGGHVVRALRKRGDAVWVWTRDADRALARFGPP